MNRRTFLKSCLAASVTASTPSFADITNKKTYKVSFEFDLSHIKDNVSLWVPLPSNTNYQTISNIEVTTSGKNYFFNSKNSYNAATFFQGFKKEDELKTTSLSFFVSTKDVKRDFGKKTISNSTINEAKKYTLPTAHVQIDGIVKETSDKICAPYKTELQKARAIYDWVVQNMYRDPNVKGCGAGNAKEALEQKKYGGKCLDISAVFVALLRAQSIPARELMGLRLGKSSISNAFGSDEDITSAQHCRAEFFIKDIGWIKADPGDITKLRLIEKLGRGAPREKEIADMYFGGFEMNWMELNHARDFELHPTPTQYPLDQFNYPYGEVADLVLDFYDAKTFQYSLKSIQIS
ncbi:MAG: transglutaminase-like domain-containing protein [Campylobacterales bacterium]|nr:transglutaminase-like domain-containing protein [Campylobacterales bacterium]